MPAFQLQQRQVQGRQRARARGVDHAIGSGQVEAVGDPARHHIAQHAGEGVLGPWRVLAGDSVADGLDLCRLEAMLSQGMRPYGSLHPGTELSHQLGRRGHTQDHAHAAAVHGLELSPGRVIEHLLGNQQCQQLGGVDGREVRRRDGEFERVEVHRLKKRAALGVDLVDGRRIWIEVVVNQPVGGRHLSDQVPSRQDVPPEPRRVARSGVQGTDTDDGNLHGVFGCLAGRFRHEGISKNDSPPGAGAYWVEVLRDRVRAVPQAERHRSNGIDFDEHVSFNQA